MNQQTINARAQAAQDRARRVLQESHIADIWRDAGCRVSIVGSLSMGLLAAHRDIDLHVYSRAVTEAGSFAIASIIARDPQVKEIRCINGLHTSEHCVAWHIIYDFEGEDWQFDVIHIEEGTAYDGYFEHMAARIVAVMTPEHRQTILRLKFEDGPHADIHGVEFYEAVIAHGISTLPELTDWTAAHRRHPHHYWIP